METDMNPNADDQQNDAAQPAEGGVAPEATEETPAEGEAAM